VEDNPTVAAPATFPRRGATYPIALPSKGLTASAAGIKAGAILPIPATFLLVMKVCKATIIVYTLVNAVCMVVHAMSYDVIRNIILKYLY
jgi:hypothetical protein